MSSRADGPEAHRQGAHALVDMHALLRELAEAHRDLARQSAAVESLSQARESMLAVARLIPGMNKNTWEELRRLLPLHGWCALEVSGTGDTLCHAMLSDGEAGHAPSDPLTGALLTAPLVQQLAREAARAERGKSPLAVAALALDPQWSKTSGAHSAQAAALALAEAVQCRCLNCDSLGRLNAVTFALVLPGAGLFKAQAVVEEVLAACRTEERPFPYTAGIAGGTGQACRDAVPLLEQAASALREAQESGETVRVYRAPTHPQAERRTLVQSHEKRFLFSGGE